MYNSVIKSIKVKMAITFFFLSIYSFSFCFNLTGSSSYFVIAVLSCFSTVSDELYSLKNGEREQKKKETKTKTKQNKFVGLSIRSETIPGGPIRDKFCLW